MWIRRAVVVALAAMTAVSALIGAGAEGYVSGAQSDTPPLALALAGTLGGLGWAGAGAVIASVRPANAVGWLLLVVGALTQLSLTEEAAARAGWLGVEAAAGDWTARLPGLLLTLLAGWGIMTMLAVLPAVYPEGRPRPHEPKWPVALACLGAAAIQIQWITTQPSLGGSAYDGAGPGLTAGVLGLVPLTVFMVGAGSIWLLAVRALLRSPSPLREQLGWLLGSVVLVLVLSLLGDDLPLQVAQVASLYLLPVAIAVALLRYQLLGVDAAPRRDPMRTVADIGTKVSMSDDRKVLPTLLSSVRRSVASPAARLLDPAGRVIASSGELTHVGFSAGLAAGGTPVGVLEVEPRWPSTGFTEREKGMLHALSTQLGELLRSQRLAEQLEAQRDLALTARTEERARLRRELHDGLGPALTGIGLGLAGLEDSLRASDLDRAVGITGVLRRETAGTVREVRRVLDDLRPEVLEGLGLADAIRHRVATIAPTLPVDVNVGRLPVLPPSVELTAYRVVAEAVTNAARHAGASRVAVDIWVDETAVLVAEVRDDGSGFTAVPAPTAGMGLTSMRERAADLGGTLAIESSAGGTLVTLKVPAGVAVG